MKHLPNVLTASRIAVTPVFLVLLLGGTLTGQAVAVALFIAGAITDWLDGRLARQYGAGSRLGQFLDPLADKVLVLGAFFALLFLPPDALGRRLHEGWWWWAVSLIALRDVAVTALRSRAERRGQALQTSYAAKVKTTVQLTFLIATMVFLVAAQLARFEGGVGALGGFAGSVVYGPVTDVLLLVTVVLTLWTGALYFRRPRRLEHVG